MDSKAVECYRLSVDDENSAVRMNSAADVWVGRLVDGGWFLQHVIGRIVFAGKNRLPHFLVYRWTQYIIMVALCNRADHYIFILFLSSSFFFFLLFFLA